MKRKREYKILGDPKILVPQGISERSRLIGCGAILNSLEYSDI